MIKISKPFKETNSQGDVLLKALVEDELGKKYLWFSTEEKNQEFFNDDRGDAFLLALLLYAIKTGQNIEIDASVSEKLWYNIKTSLIHILAYVYHAKKIDVIIKKNESGNENKLLSENYNSKAVATGCSLGVDSFASIISHQGENCSENYRLTHLTYFNIGGFGFNDLGKAKESYEKDLGMVQAYADESCLPLVCVQSNVPLWYQGFSLDQFAVLIYMATVLSMQKLFRRYYYSSSFPVNEIKLDEKMMHYYETLLLPLCSTESTDLIVSNADMTRVDKTKLIVGDPFVQKYLYVCWKEIWANGEPNSVVAKIKNDHINCSYCDKCLRTLLTIDILGEIEKYRGLFDVDYYYQVKKNYLIKIYAFRKSKYYYNEIYNLIQETKYPVPTSVKFRAPIRRLLRGIGFQKIGIISKLYNNKILKK